MHMSILNDVEAIQLITVFSVLSIALHGQAGSASSTHVQGASLFEIHLASTESHIRVDCGEQCTWLPSVLSRTASSPLTGKFYTPWQNLFSSNNPSLSQSQFSFI